MSLKTTYRDDKFSGRRKYRMIENEDGTISFDDVTDYAEEGDIFSSNDINVTNKAINDANEKIKTTKKQIEDVPGITAEDSPSVGGPWLGDSPSVDVAKNRKKAFGYVDRAVSGEGTIMLYCYGSRPTVDFSIMIKGV